MSTGGVEAGRAARCYPSHPNIHSELTAGLEMAIWLSGRCSSVSGWSLAKRHILTIGGLLSHVFFGKTLI